MSIDYVYAIDEIDYRSGYVVTLDSKDVERLARLIDIEVVEVTDDNNQLDLYSMKKNSDMDKSKKKKKKSKKNESRISGFENFRKF